MWKEKKRGTKHRVQRCVWSRHDDYWAESGRRNDQGRMEGKGEQLY